VLLQQSMNTCPLYTQTSILQCNGQCNLIKSFRSIFVYNMCVLLKVHYTLIYKLHEQKLPVVTFWLKCFVDWPRELRFCSYWNVNRIFYCVQLFHCLLNCIAYFGYNVIKDIYWFKWCGEAVCL